jgi:TonB family protein
VPAPNPAPPRPPAAARPLPFPRPIARSLAELGAEAAPRAARPQQRRGLDLALGPVARASNGAVPRNTEGPTGFMRIEGADLGADWERALHDWWDRHGFYPEQAAAQNEDGTTQIRVVLDRSGKVHSVELESRSGSQWIDMGSLAIFRGATLPPFPPSTPQNEATLHLTLNFILIGKPGG